MTLLLSKPGGVEIETASATGYTVGDLNGVPAARPRINGLRQMQHRRAITAGDPDTGALWASQVSEAASPPASPGMTLRAPRRWR